MFFTDKGEHKIYYIGFYVRVTQELGMNSTMNLVVINETINSTLIYSIAISLFP